MKKASLIIALAFITNLLFSQEMKTLFKKDTAKIESYGGYGAPMVGASMMGKYWGVMLGGKGGLIRNHHFGIGGIGAAVIGNSSSSMTDTIVRMGRKDSTFKHNLVMGYGGIYLEYIFNYDSPIHVSLPLNICVGGVWAGGERSSSTIKSSTVFIVEPGINIEFNFSKHFVPALNVGYKIVLGNSTNLSGLNVGLVFKLGKF
jgi:hypothetical protein